MRGIIIGIDGADWKLLNSMDLPNIKGIAEKYSGGVLKSTIPPFSPIAWNSLFTGAKPYEHGIHGFIQPKPNSYDYEIVNSKTRKVKAIWNYLPGIYLNIPFAYPCEKIDGILTAGLGSPDEGYGEGKYNIQSHKFITHSFNVLKKEIKQAKKLFKNDWQIFTVVFRLTDILQHYYYDNIHLLHRAYKKIDNFVGFVMENKQEDDVVMVVSDHGFCGASRTFCVNTWLQKRGYLYTPTKVNGMLNKIAEVIKNSPLKGIALSMLSRPFFGKYIKHIPLAGFDVMKTINKKTKAYYVPGSCTSITLNLKGRQPDGGVSRNKYDRTVNKIVRDLKGLKDKNRRVIRKVYKVSEYYHVDPMEISHDIVFLLEPGYIFRSHDKSNKVFADIDTGVNGTHTENGIYIGTTEKPIKSIYKITPWLLERIQDDDKIVKERLKNLGYLE